jgi:hypothetical protein
MNTTGILSIISLLLGGVVSPVLLADAGGLLNQ